MTIAERWPVTYDFDSLLAQIRDLCISPDFQRDFYLRGGPLNSPQQGDLINFKSSIPVIWEDAQPAIYDDVDYWLVVGNTCDFTRDMKDTTFTQIAPVIEVELRDSPSIILSDLQKYKYSRRFYIPPWNDQAQGKVYLADFQRLLPIHKMAFDKDSVEKAASLSRASWFLLHCCLVRFLCRDDGRHGA